MSEAAEQSTPPRRAAAAPEAAAPFRLRRRRGPQRNRRSNSGLALRVVLFTLGGVILLGAACVSVLYLMLVRGPVNADMLGGRIASSLSARLGGAYAVTVGNTTIESGAHGPFIAVSDLQVAGAGGQSVFIAPRATVALDLPRLAIGQVTPRRIELFDLELKLVLTPDGAVAVSAGAAPFLVGRAPGGDPSAQSAPLLPPVGEHAAVRALGDALRRTLAVAVGAQSPAGSIEHIGISRGRLSVDDQAGNRSAVFESLELAVDRDHESALLSISATGPNGRWSVAAQARGDGSETNEGPRSLELEVRDLSAAEMSLMFNLQAPPIDFDTPVSARLQLGLDERGRLQTAAGRFALGSGFFYFRNRDHEPLRVDEITGRMNWDAQARRFDVGPVNYQAGRSNLTVSGRIEPPHENAQQWRIELAALPGVLGAERPGEMDVALASAKLVARVDPGAKTAQLESFDLAGPQLAMTMSGDGQWLADDRRLRARVDISDTAAQAVLRIWPSIVAPYARAWFLSHKNKGRVEKARIAVEIDEKAFVSLQAMRGLDDSAVSVEGNVVDAELAFMPGMPPVSGLSGRLRVSGRTAAFNITSGYIETGPERRLTISEGRFESGEFGSPSVKGLVNVRASGSLDAAAELIAAEGLKPFGGFALEPGLVRGQVDGRVTVDLSFDPVRPPAVRVATQISNMSVERVVGRERLDQASLTLTADASGVRAAGQGRLFGTQVKIELRRAPGSATEATVSAMVDEATRARHGWQSANLSGVIGAKVTTLLGGPEKPRPVVELDLTRAGIAAIAGFSKPAGRPAKATFVVHQEPQQITLQSFAFEAGPASAQGVIELDASGGFTAANFSQLKLSPGDDMKAEISSTRDGGFRAQVRAASIDARPFVQELLGASGKESATSPALDLDVRSNLVTGANGQALSGFDLKLVTRAEGVREFRLAARSGRAALSGGPVAGQPGAALQYYVRTEDGGALLAFLDLYRRMDGGQLQLTAQGNGRRSTGALTVRNFTLRNEATLQKLVAEGARGREAQLPIDPTAVPFDRLEVAFSRNNGRLDLRDGVVSGPSVGATIEGGIDFTRDQVALNGTFVPAYGLNNMFSRIPLFGPLLGGGANEGLIGINFRITGSASAPVLSLNPLSAMTPGFLRKIFGAADAVTLPPQSFPAQPQQRGKPAMPMSINPR